MSLFIRSLSLSHTLSIFHRLLRCFLDVLRELADLQSCSHLAKYLSFFLGVLLQDSVSKVSFWTFFAFTLFQSPHSCSFSESPALQFLFKLLCLVSMVCIRLFLLPPVRLLFLRTCAHVNLCWSFGVALWISRWLHLLNFRKCLTGFFQHV